MNVQIEESWKRVLQDEFNQYYFLQITQFLKTEYKQNRIYPPASKIFNAFNLCPFDKLKIVILGQDPYHGPGQAHGLSFSVQEGIPLPPSLQNIYKELKTDVNSDHGKNGNLTSWAVQGVFLLNSILTVEEFHPTSHKNIGWETFTDNVIKIISEKKDHAVFILWGAFAIKKSEFIDKNKHFIITSPHPSPLSASRGFFGSRPFSRANEYLKKNNITEIKW